jgi:hypothetical protein
MLDFNSYMFFKHIIFDEKEVDEIVEQIIAPIIRYYIIKFYHIYIFGEEFTNLSDKLFKINRATQNTIII